MSKNKAEKFYSASPYWISIFSFFLSVFGFLKVQVDGTSLVRIIEWAGLGLSFRFDSLSTLIFLMISILSVFVVKFSRNYLDGEQTRTRFFGKLMLTISFVQLLVLANNMFLFFLAWVAMSISLQRLILLYPNRFHAQLAGMKKFIAARVSDSFLLISFFLIYQEFKTGDFQTIFDLLLAQDFVVSNNIEWAILALVSAAAAKSAQFPFHTWLIEVMETPTPVSALLHAGLLNAGPFLMLRFSFLLEESVLGSALLIIIGLISAIFGSIVYTTQPSIKTALSYSSVAHMGFTLMLCGFGLYAAALLHLVSHSFYKAHAFLSTGSMVDRVKSLQFVRVQDSSNPLNVLFALIFSLLVFSACAWIFDVDLRQESRFLLIGGVFMIGITSYFTNAMNNTKIWDTLKIVGSRVAFISLSFFTLEHLMAELTHGVLPEIALPHTIILVLLGLTLFVLAIVGFSLMSPVVSENKKSTWNKLSVHIRNGFYVNQFFDRFLAEKAAKRMLKHKPKKFQ